VATLSIHAVSEYDVAAGMALLRAAGGVLLDAAGKPAQLTGTLDGRLSGCFAGAPEAARQLAAHDWKALENEPRQAPRVALGFPRPAPAERLARAQGCLLGQVIGDSFGSLVELKSASRSPRSFPARRDSPTAASTHHRRPADRRQRDGDRAGVRWFSRKASLLKKSSRLPGMIQTRPVDIGTTTERGLLGLNTTDSDSNGSLMRVAPIGIWAAGDPARAAEKARADSALTHRNPVCVEACAGYAAAIAAGVAGASREEMRAAALANSRGRAREAIESASLPQAGRTAGWSSSTSDRVSRRSSTPCRGRRYRQLRRWCGAAARRSVGMIPHAGFCRCSPTLDRARGCACRLLA
jgi:hypothetical protein